MSSHRHHCSLFFSVFVIVLLAVTVGCSNSESPVPASSPAAAPGGATSAPVAVAGAAAPAAYTSNCAGCHAINGAGGHNGPDLSHTGAEAEHTADWLAGFIKNPKSKNPSSRMPGFEGRLSDTDIQNISTYLASLK